MITVRTLTDGIAEDYTFEDWQTATSEAFFDSACSLYRRNDWTETTIQLINSDGTIAYETTIEGGRS